MNIIKKGIFALSTVSAILLSGCGSDDTVAQQEITGVLADGAIGNAEYRCGSKTGKTNTDGEFNCPVGSSVSFYIGSLKIGSVSTLPSDNVVLIQDALGMDRNETANSTVLSLAQLLQSLDDDSNHENGIFLTDLLITSLSNTLGNAETKFKDLNSTKLNEIVLDANKTLIDVFTAQANLEDTTSRVKFNGKSGVAHVNTKVNNTGTLDTTFANTGYISLDYTAQTNDQEGHDILVDKLGNIYVAGYTHENGHDILLVKYKKDGTLDATFGGGDGIVTYDSSKQDDAYDIEFDSKGNILIAGRSDKNATILKYKKDGTLDPSFGTNGIAMDYNATGGASDMIFDIAIDSHNSIFATGTTNNGANEDIIVWKFDSNGSLNNSFGTNGRVVYNKGLYEQGTAITIDNNGSIFVMGKVDNNISVLKFDSNGSLNTSFATNGVAISTLGKSPDNRIGGIELDSDGNIFVGGATTKNVYDMALLKYKKNGTLDTSFGTNGIVTYNDAGNFRINNQDPGIGLVLDTNGNIFVGGYTITASESVNTAVWKYKSNGTLDTSFGTNGIVLANALAGKSDGYDYSFGIAIDRHNKVYLSGFSQTDTKGAELTIIKYK